MAKPSGHQRLSQKSKLVLATGWTIISLFSILGSTAAWFTAIKKVKAEGSGFETQGYDGLVKSIRAYSFSKITEEGNYLFDSSVYDHYLVNQRTGAVTLEGDKKVSFGKYDSLDSKPAYAILYSIEFSTEIASKKEKGISLSVKTTTEKDNSLCTKPLNQNNNPRSSIRSFSAPFITEQEVYSIKDDSDQSFLSLSAGDNGTTIASYSTSLSLPITDTIPTSASSFFVEVIAQYNSENIEYIYNLNLGNDILSFSGADYISYKQDWSISIS